MQYDVLMPFFLHKYQTWKKSKTFAIILIFDGFRIARGETKNSTYVHKESNSKKTNLCVSLRQKKFFLSCKKG